MSTLMTTTMDSMEKVASTLYEKGIPQVKIAVGGTHFSREFAELTGATYTLPRRRRP